MPKRVPITRLVLRKTKRNLKKIAKDRDMSEGKLIDAMVKTLAEVEGKQ